MIVGQFTYPFEDLPVLDLGNGRSTAPVTGEAIIQFDTNTRGWKIEAIFLEDFDKPKDPKIQLMPDLGPESCGPFELVHDALKIDREDAIGDMVDRIIDTENRDGLAR